MPFPLGDILRFGVLGYKWLSDREAGAEIASVVALPGTMRRPVPARAGD